jgi:hypothetical protein
VLRLVEIQIVLEIYSTFLVEGPNKKDQGNANQNWCQ